jgi:4-alpha-glucanotransferase
MHVLQWAFERERGNPHHPSNHRENGAVYTGTHDNDTAVGWFHSRARLAIVPAQDVLGLGSEARMNSPGRADGNWRSRLETGQLTDELAARLRRETERGGRLPR